MARVHAFVFVSIFSFVGCSRGPNLPTEDEARAAFQARSSKITLLEAELRKEIAATGLEIPAVECTPPDDAACLESRRRRDKAVTEAEKRLEVARRDAADLR